MLSGLRAAIVLGGLLMSGAWGFAPLPAAAQGAMSDETISVGGRDRRFLVHDFSGGAKAPLVIVLHGGGGNPENAVSMTQFDVVAAREHLIAVYPGGTGGLPGGRVLTWNAGHCCAYALRQKVDDVGFVGAVIDRLVSAGKADPDRVYVTGMSNGGMMSHVLARSLPGKVAAIAPVVGAVFGDEPPPAGPVAVLVLVGADDRIVPAAGGPLGGAAARGTAPAEDRNVAPARAQADDWARANGCSASDTTQETASVRTVWRGCKGGADVVMQVVSNNGHAWPGGRPGREGANPPTPDFNASEVIWAFFKAHPCTGRGGR